MMEDMEIDSIDNYDFRRARLSVALRWLLNASFGRNIPAELKEPLPLKDKDTVTAIYVNTGLVSLLVNSRLYIQACRDLFPSLAGSLQSGGHWCVIHSLSRLGVYVEDQHGQAITERELVQTNPFHLTAHVTLIETIMSAYTFSIATTERIVQAVKAVGPFNASEDLPIDIEDGLLVWMNKISIAYMKRQQATNNNQSAVGVGHKRQPHEVGGSVPRIQLMEDILKDVTDGCSLCVLISFYCPKQLPYPDIHIADTPEAGLGFGDSIHNILLVKKFCDNYLPIGAFHFTTEDILYSAETIKPSLLAFITQLFYYFVVEPLDIVCGPSAKNIHNQAGKTIPNSARHNHPSIGSVAAHNSSHPPHSSHELISDATKKSFQPTQPSTSTSRLSNTADHYDSNSSLNASANTSSSRLLHKRPSQTDNFNMHDTLSPIVVRKSQSMGILNTPDPKQSLVAWESKSYYIDRPRNQDVNRMSTTSNGSTSLLSNVSFHDGSDDSDTSPPSSREEPRLTNSTKSVQLRQQGRLSSRAKGADRVKSSGSEISNSYQRLLDRSNDMESPLKQFAQKHGFQLAPQTPPAESGQGDESKSTSAEELTSSDFTKITPRSDSETSPRPANTEPRNTGAVGQSYVISSALTADGAYAAGIPVIKGGVADSCTEVTFTSIAEGGVGQDDALDSPIQPIQLCNGMSTVPQANGTDPHHGEVTSFKDMSLSQGSATRSSTDVSTSSLSSRLKQRFEDQRSTSTDVKPPKKTTFSMNQTTWSDNVRLRSDSEADSDSISETSEASADVRMLLEEKRKAMAKKKTLEDLERTKELSAASQQAFLKAVTKNKNQPNHDSRRSDDTKISRTDVSRTIENLQTKLQKDDQSSGKRLAPAATTSATAINVTPAALDNIAELSESTSEVESPNVPLPSMTSAATVKEEQRNTSTNQHEAPVDVGQYGLDKLNESLSELRGEMKKLSEEQLRIEELQLMMNASLPQSRSTPRSKFTEAAVSTPQARDTQIDSSLVKDSTLRRSDLDKLTSSGSKWSTQPDSRNHEHLVTRSLHTETSDAFSQPNIQSMSQSTNEPFILHGTDKHRSKASSKRSEQSGVDDTPKPGPMRRTNSNGFLSSSQLSRKKTPAQSSSQNTASTPDSATLDQSGGRRKWSANNGPLFPGYDDDYKSKISLREPDMATRDNHPAFQPPPDTEAPDKASQGIRKASATRRHASSADSQLTPERDSLQIHQLPGHRIPQELLDDTPMRDPERYGGVHSRPTVHSHPVAQYRPDLDDTIDTPLRGPDVGSRIPPRSAEDITLREFHAYQGDFNMSGLVTIAPSPNKQLTVDTPLRQQGHQHIDTSNRENLLDYHRVQHPPFDSDMLDTPLRQDFAYRNSSNLHGGKQRPQSMIETINTQAMDDTPIRDAMRNNPSLFYSPPTREIPQAGSLESYKQTNAESVIDTPKRAQATSRYGAVAVPPQATSRHGIVHADSQAKSHAVGNPGSDRLVRAPYEHQPEPDQPRPSSQSTYKLNTPYGTADNEIKPVDSSVSLSSAMDAIRIDMIKQHGAANSCNSNMAFTVSPPQPMYNPPSHHMTMEPHIASPHSSMSPGQHQPPPACSQGVVPLGVTRRISSGSSDIESALADIGSTHSQSTAQLSRPGSAGHMTVSSLNRQQSADNDDKISLHSYGSGSAESESGTPRSNGKPKRATWDMSTPRGDVLNQPGVGFIVAGQAKLSEEELIRRKEKVLMMQLKRREEQELKKQQKAAELAAKAEAARMKELEVEKKKLEEKAKKEAILLQFQQQKAEEELPPERRAQFRQRQKPKRGGERPASIHWAGSSVTEDSFLRGSDNMDSASSFTVPMGSGNLTHRRAPSPANSFAAGSLSSRSKVSSVIDAPSDEYTGPKLYVKPSQKQRSNRTIIINAISHCCLAGVVNTDNKNKVLTEIAKSDGKHFLILFRDGNQTYKAVYSFCPESEECIKVHGQGPKFIKDDMCHRFYKYNSGGKNFTEVLSTKHLSVSLDAITIHNHLWQKKAGGPRR